MTGLEKAVERCPCFAAQGGVGQLKASGTPARHVGDEAELL
jgi:hypothetical protein